MITWSSLFWIDLVSDCFTNFSEDLEKFNRREYKEENGALK